MTAGGFSVEKLQAGEGRGGEEGGGGGFDPQLGGSEPPVEANKME